MTQTTIPMNFHTVRELLGLKQFAVADAASLNRQRLSWIEVGYRDPTSSEDERLRRVLLRVIDRRKEEIEAAAAWLQSGDKQAWGASSKRTFAGTLADSRESPP